MTGKIDKCEHGFYGYEACEACATKASEHEIQMLRDEAEELRFLAQGAVEEYPIASGLYIDTDGQDGYGNLRAMRLFLKECEPVEQPTLSALAEVIHNARFGPDYPRHLVNSFDREGFSGQEYCYRLARAVMTHFRVAQRRSALKSAPGFKAPQQAEREPSVTPACPGAGTSR